MTEPKLDYVLCPDAGNGHRMAYWQWGNPRARHVVVCVHGLSRQGRDFDVLARALVESAGRKIRVVCPDVVGRGQSDWLKDPQEYHIPAYTTDMLALLTQLRPGVLDWVGTSMGGLIGIALCGQTSVPPPVPVRRLVLNDVGPSVAWQAVERIGAFLSDTGHFASVEQAAQALWAASPTFGPHSAAQWLEFSRHMVKPLAGAGGAVTLHYDPAIAASFRALTPESWAQADALLWQLYDNITASTLLLRGAQSDLLTRATARAMTRRGPRAKLREFKGVGHAPTLIAEDQVQAVLSFLLDESARP